MARGPGGGDHPPINISVRDQEGKEMTFRVKYGARLDKLLKTYCEKRELDHRTVQFLYNGKRVITRSTPAGLNMKGDDCIDAMMHMHGGSSCFAQEEKQIARC